MYMIVGCRGLRLIGGRKLSMYGCANVESLDLQTSFGLISLGIGRVVDDGCRLIVAAAYTNSKLIIMR
jgi:hypothetical protein